LALLPLCAGPISPKTLIEQARLPGSLPPENTLIFGGKLHPQIFF